MPPYVEAREQPVGVCSLFPPRRPRNRTYAVTLSHKHLYPLSHLPSPDYLLFETVFNRGWPGLLAILLPQPPQCLDYRPEPHSLQDGQLLGAAFNLFGTSWDSKVRQEHTIAGLRWGPKGGEGRGRLEGRFLLSSIASPGPFHI